MGLNIVKKNSNMYQGWLTHTWNAIKGKCPHDCTFCYMKRWGEQPPLHLDEKELRKTFYERKDLQLGSFVFIGSSCDMWAEAIPDDWIRRTLLCGDRRDITYLFQSKNPARYLKYPELAHKNNSQQIILGTTIETNRVYPQMGKAPPPRDRIYAMQNLRGRKMITIEPIMDFELSTLVAMIKIASPEWVNIGADSRGCNLPEPSGDKVRQLIEALREFTEVKTKTNLQRLMK